MKNNEATEQQLRKGTCCGDITSLEILLVQFENALLAFSRVKVTVVRQISSNNTQINDVDKKRTKQWKEQNEMTETKIKQ